MLFYFYIVYGCFCAKNAKFKSCRRDPQSLKCLLPRSLEKMFVDPCTGQMKELIYSGMRPTTFIQRFFTLWPHVFEPHMKT